MPTPPPPTGGILLLNGFPGVGKLTIARAVQAKLSESSTPTRLIDNHLLIDLAQAITPGRGPAHKTLRANLRRVAFHALISEIVANPDLVVIMTGCLEDTEEDVAVLAEHVRIAREGKVPFYLFNITCEREQHLERFRDGARYAEGKTKLGDEGVLREILEGHVLVGLEMVREEMGRGVELKGVVVDTTGRDVGESAGEVLRCVGMGWGEEE